MQAGDDRDHGDHVHDADGRSSDEDVAEVLSTGCQDKAAVLEGCKTRANTDGRETEFVIGRFKDVKAEQQWQEFHEFLDDR